MRQVMKFLAYSSPIVFEVCKGRSRFDDRVYFGKASAGNEVVRFR